VKGSPKLFIISGCNGAGKTTASFNILPQILDCKQFLNADEIARGLSPFDPESVSIEAGRILLNRFDELVKIGETFAVETTLATLIYKDKILKVQSLGYEVTLLYFWLTDVNMAYDRVNSRVMEGGHNIPKEVIKRRYFKGIKNLFNIYLPLCERALIIDNSDSNPELIFTQSKGSELEIINENLYTNLLGYLLCK
jgi:predicted ABC-type ATPase